MTSSTNKAAATEAAQQRAEYIGALEQERAGYAARGLRARVAQVDAELKRLKSTPAGRRAEESTTATTTATVDAGAAPQTSAAATAGDGNPAPHGAGATTGEDQPTNSGEAAKPTRRRRGRAAGNTESSEA